jgi:hypothetical protein
LFFGTSRRCSRKRPLNSSWKSITASNKVRWILTDNELWRNSYLSLIQELSHIDFYSTRKSRDKVQALESCARWTLSCINYQLGGMLIDLNGSTSQSEIIWLKRIYLSLIR